MIWQWNGFYYGGGCLCIYSKREYLQHVDCNGFPDSSSKFFHIKERSHLGQDSSGKIQTQASIVLGSKRKSNIL